RCGEIASAQDIGTRSAQRRLSRIDAFDRAVIEDVGLHAPAQVEGVHGAEHFAGRIEQRRLSRSRGQADAERHGVERPPALYQVCAEVREQRGTALSYTRHGLLGALLGTLHTVALACGEARRLAKGEPQWLA